jgi:mono/diheme cytochrome c family protein
MTHSISLHSAFLSILGVVFAADVQAEVKTSLAENKAASASVGELSFNRDIRPILAEKCFFCHGPDPGTRKAELRLDTEAGLFSPHKDNPAPVLKGNVGESELVKRITSTDSEEVMPPPKSHKELKPEEVALLKQWIAQGAPWQPHWAFIPPEKAAFPSVKNEAWVKTPLDRFILAKLEEKGLQPAPEAEPRVLFRRLHLDLTGLPPSKEDLEAFLTDYAMEPEQALSQWIDRLMHSTAWGEHRARYWLDAARYGDTHGLHIDNYREMWLYRDWVIRAFNSNKLFSDFTVEQIAGDLLPKPKEDQLVATGFQRCNITTAEGGTIAEENLANYAADRVQTMGWVYLGLTMNCAQCHDHKFDPVTQRDYYSMAAFFRNTTQGASDGNAKDGRGPVLVVPMEADRGRWKELPTLLTKERENQKSRIGAGKADFENWLTSATPEGLTAGRLSEKLVLRAPLNEGQGKESKRFLGVEDSEGKVLASNSELSWAAGGKFGDAPVFGKTTGIFVGDVADFDVKQPFSYGAWVKVGKADGSAGILSRMDTKAKLRGFDLYQSGKSFAVHLIDAWPEKAIKVTTPAAVKAGAWQHVFVTYDGSGKAAGVKVYVDGKDEKLRVEKNDIAEGSIRSKAEFVIGQRGDGGGFEGGSVQDVRVYGRALSSLEVKGLMDLPGIRTALMAAEKRTPAQRNVLQDHYFNTFDKEYMALNEAISKLTKEQDAIRERSPLTHIQEEVKDKMPMANVLVRGQYNKLGDAVEAVPPAALHALPDGAPKNRLGLAQWLVDKRNPLTPRVTVNRFWQEVFGQGLVRTSEDFGLMGATPSNQALLDWLAADFRDNGGDVRHLFKLMLTSAAYRQASIVTPEKLEKDRDNALLSRGPRFRMDAEMVRDNALATSGLLVSKLYGPPVRPYQPESIWDVVGLPNGNTRNYVQDHGESLYRRTLYNFWKRMAPPPNLDIFNAPSREVSCLRRERTNTPLQALVTLNDPQFVEAARHLAETALVAAGNQEEKVVDYIIEKALARPVQPKERKIIMDSRRDFLKHYETKPDDASALLGVGETKARLPELAVTPAQLASWTMVCNEVLNLDEALNK